MPLHALTLRAIAIACLALPFGLAQGQGAIRPLEAIVVNPESRPVPVTDKTVAEAVKALAAAAGREPYQHAISFNQGPAACSPHVCLVPFPAVPVGKRLVITHVSARYGLPAGNLFANVGVGQVGNTDDFVILYAQSTGPGSYVASSPVTLYVAAGARPEVRLTGNNAGFASLTATASVVGYLVDAP